MGHIKGKYLNFEKIIEKNNICRIFFNNGKVATGFFCIIPLNESKHIKAVMLGNSMHEEDDLEKGVVIKMPLKNEEEKTIVIDKERLKYFNNTFGITIIEIKDSDGINNESFLEIDMDNKISIEQKIYLLFYSVENRISFSTGMIKEHFKDNKSLIIHSCYNDNLEGSSGEPLLNESNNKVIGIDIGKSENHNEKKTGIIIKDAIEEFKKNIINLNENNQGGTIIQRITSNDEFKKRYDSSDYKVYHDKVYTIKEGHLKISGKPVVIKTYYNFSKKYLNLIKEEQAALSKIRNKFVIKLKDYYISFDKSMLIFDDFCANTLENYNNSKKEFPLDRIQQFLIQINDAIKELDKFQINDFILTPENICLFHGKIVSLFPFYKLIKNNKEFLLKDSLKDLKYINPNIHNFDKKEHILFNIGALINEMHFGELPYEIIYDKNNYYSDIKLKGFKNSSSRNFDNLIENLLKVDKNSFTWDDYINCDFLKTISPEEKFSIFYPNAIYEPSRKSGFREERIPLKKSTGLDLRFNEVSEENLLLLSKIDFNNLIWLNLSNNKIENLEFITASLKNLKILSLEDNNLNNLNVGKELSNIKDLEHLFLGSNSIENINFSSKDLIYLTNLSLFNNKISDLSSLKNCSFPNLEILNLSFNKITDISYLCKADFKFLKELYLNNNKISNINDLQNAFPFLELLNLEKNSIFDINIFNKALFSNTIKELNLDSNPLSKYEELNLSYFPSIKRFNLGNINEKNENLLWISMKVQLFGYELSIESSKEKNEIIIEANDKISILFFPSSYKYIYKDLKDFKKRKTFKIITNSNITQEELGEFLIDDILHLPNEKFNGKNFIYNEIGKKNIMETKKINNYSIFFYDDKNDIIKERIESNIINLAEEYKNTHELTEKYNKIPGYLDNQNYSSLPSLRCELFFKNNEYYSKIPYMFMDKKYVLRKLVKDSYFLKLPLVYINSEYIERFIQFLNYYNKYKDFKKYDDIFLKHFLIPYLYFSQYHFGNLSNVSIFAVVMEDISFNSEYNIKIISEIKKKIFIIGN